MSLLLDALQRSQNKSKAQASVPTDLPPLDVTPLDVPLPDAPKQAQDSPSLELTLDPICDAPPEPARSPEHLAEPVATPAPVTVTQAPPSVPADPPAPTEPLKPSASPQPSASFTAGTTAGQATAAAASPAPSVPAMPLGTGGEPRSQVTAREAAQAMLGGAGAAATQRLPQAQGEGSRGRRLLWSLVIGVALAGLTSMAWQYWQATQTPGLTPAAEAQPSAAAGQDEVVMMQESASAAVPGETMVETEAPADTVATAARPSDIGSVTPVAAASPTATAAKRASQRTPTSSTTSTSTPAPSVARAAPAPAPARQLETGDRPAQLVRSQTQSQLQIAWSALRQGEAARAQTLYQQVLASRPDDPDATLGLAVSLHRQRQLEAAWLAYQRSLQMWPDNETARTGMLAILSESDPDTAESRLQEWVQSRPRDAAAQAALGNLLGRQGRWAQALGPLTLAQSLAPDSAPHAYNLAVALDQARRYDDALQMYRYTLQLGAAGVSAQALERRIAELQGVAAR